MRFKKLLTAAAAVITAAVCSLGCFAQDSGFYVEHELAVTAKTPSNKKYVNIAWSTPEAENGGIPVAFGNYVLLPTANRIEKISEADGKTEKSLDLSENVSTTCRGAVLGNTYVQPTENGIAVINAQSMELVSFREFGAPICTDVALIDDRAFFAAGETEFTFYCVDLANGLSTVWEYKSDSRISSPSLYGGFIVVSAGTRLVCLDSKTGEPVENELYTKLIGAPFAAEYAVYCSAADGNLLKLRLNPDGTIEDDTLVSCKIGGELSPPLMFNGKVYVSSSEGFYIIDSLTMEQINALTDIKGASAPVIAYGNGLRIYVTAPADGAYYLYNILDADTLDEPAVDILAKLDYFSGGSIEIAQSGKMYFRDDIGRVFTLEVLKYSVVLMIVKLVLLVVLLVLVLLWLRTWAKKRNANKPPQY